MGSAAELASIGEMEITASASASSEVADGEGVDEGVGVNTEEEAGVNEEEEAGANTEEVVAVNVGGSFGSSRAVSGECSPTVFKGRRKVPLFGLGTSPKESQIIL